MRLLPVIYALMIAIMPSLSIAHETFLLPVAPVQTGQYVELGLTSGTAFPASGSGPKAARVTIKAARIGVQSPPVVVIGESASILRFGVAPEQAGWMMVAVELGQHPIELGAAKVAEYFEEIDPDAGVRAAYAAMPAPQVWRELYTKHAKTLVCVAPCLDAAAALARTGQALEFVAADIGMRRFILLESGSPRAGQPIELIDKSGTTMLRTDAAGAVSLPPAANGDLLLSTTVVRVPARPGAPFTSDFATLTLPAR